MTDEAAMMLRIGIFGVVAAAVYWFLSYEWLGTVALLTLGLGPGFAGVVMTVLARKERGTGTSETAGELLRRLAGFPRPEEEPAREAAEGAEEEVGVLPLPTIWPMALALGLAVLLTGLIFGLWLVVLGAFLAAVAAWGWLDAVSRETLYGRLHR